MENLTAREFRLITRENPRWADTLTEPVNITQYCSMAGEPIQRLSKFLRFVGRDNFGQAADFNNCEFLENAAGVFHGYVDFNKSGVTTSIELDVEDPDGDGNAAAFEDCMNLKVAEGRFNGGVTWEASGIERIRNLEIRQAPAESWAANFTNCFRLKVLTGHYPGTVTAKNAGIETVEKVTVEKSHMAMTRIVLSGCPLKRVPADFLFNHRGYPMDPGLRDIIAETLVKEQKARRALKNQPTLEM